MGTALITAKQLMIMLAFMVVGYAFKKKKIFSDDASSTLSQLVVNVFLPAMVFSTFAENFRPDVIAEKAKLIFLSLIVLTVTGIISVFLAKLFSKNKNTQAVYIYSFTIPNITYMGYPLVQAIFGELALLDAMIFCLPYNIYIYTIGMYLLTPFKRMTLKVFLNPSVVAMLAGMIVGGLRLQIPGLVTDILGMAKDCMSPCAMLLTGAVFARMNVREMLLDWKSYAASAIRLLIIPITAMFILRAVGVRQEWVLITTVMLAMPLGINSVVFPEAFGGDSETGAKVCFVAGVLGLITIPFVFGLL